MKKILTVVLCLMMLVSSVGIAESSYNMTWNTACDPATWNGNPWSGNGGGWFVSLGAEGLFIFARLSDNIYDKWKAEGYWIIGGFWFGFDVTHSWAVGTERFLIAMLEEPEWCEEIYDTYLDLDIQLFDRIWDAGYRFDEINWPNDMGYKHNQFFSMNTFRNMDKPRIARAVKWAHDHGIKARMHSCGDINPFVPELIEVGMDGLNPLEVKAGMDPVYLKKTYGDKLLLHGGINAVLWDKPDLIKEEIDRVVPIMKENGGYIFASDHSIPENISLADFRGVLDEVKRVGTY